MITTSIKDQLDMVWRTENPNYIIILKNKAGKDMDFSNFTIQPAEEQPEDKLTNTRYIISVDPAFKQEHGIFNTVSGLLTVLDNDTGRFVFKVTTKVARYKEWITKLKREYKPYIVLEDATK